MGTIIADEIYSGKGLLSQPCQPCLLLGQSEVLRASDDFTMYCAV